MGSCTRGPAVCGCRLPTPQGTGPPLRPDRLTLPVSSPCPLVGLPLPTVLCFALTRSLLLTGLVTGALLGLRYYYSRKVVLAYLDCALHTDMADIEQYYMKPPGESRRAPASSSSSLCSSCLHQLPLWQNPARVLPPAASTRPGGKGRARVGPGA